MLLFIMIYLYRYELNLMACYSVVMSSILAQCLLGLWVRSRSSQSNFGLIPFVLCRRRTNSVSILGGGLSLYPYTVSHNVGS